MWPFKTKKSEEIFKTHYFGAFGERSVTYKKIFSQTQNNDYLVYLYNNFAEVSAPILKYTDGASQVLYSTKNKELERLLIKPNEYQSWAEFISTAILHKRLFGNCVIAALTATGRKPFSLNILSPQYIAVKLSGSDDFRLRKIEKYIYSVPDGRSKLLEIDAVNVLHLKEINPNVGDYNLYFGLSRYVGCVKNIESIANGYDAKVNLYKNGPRLILTGKSGGEFNSLNSNQNIEDVQDAMRKYGYGKNDYNNLVTDVPLDVHNVSLNVQQLQIIPNNLHDFQKLCDVQGMDSKMFSDSSSSTFNNKSKAISDFYNNAFKSEIDSFYSDFSKFMAKWYGDSEILPDYSNISEIANADIADNERLLGDCKLGILTRNDYLIAIGKEPVAKKEFNDYYYYTNAGWISINEKNNENASTIQ